jgi:hypothetical protein
MKNRDLGILFVCALAILISLRDEGLYTLSKQWVEVIDPKFYRNGMHPDATEHM